MVNDPKHRKYWIALSENTDAFLSDIGIIAVVIFFMFVFHVWTTSLSLVSMGGIEWEREGIGGEDSAAFYRHVMAKVSTSTSSPHP